jgi:hypothetical protein
MGAWAKQRGKPGTVGRKTRRVQGSVPLPRQSAPVLSSGVACDTAQENRTTFNSKRRSVIAAPRQRLKTGAEQRKQRHYHRRAEFFALPIVVSAGRTPNAKALRSNDPSHDFLLRGPCKYISADSGFSFFRLAKPG